MDDVLGILQIVARAGDNDAVGLAVEGDGHAANGLVARIELQHGVRDDTHDLRGVGVHELEDPRAAAGLGRLVKLLNDRGDDAQLILRPGDHEAVARGVRDDFCLRHVFRSALILDEFGGKRGGHCGDGRGLALLEFDDAHLSWLHVRPGVELRDDERCSFHGGGIAGDDEAVAACIDHHAHLGLLGVEALLDEGGDLRGQRGLESDDARLLLCPEFAGGVKLTDERLDAGDFLLRATDHDAVVLRVRAQRGGTARRLRLPLELLGVELLHEREKLGRRAAE